MDSNFMRTSVLKGALARHSRVILALGLRDIKTRFGSGYVGFLLGLLLPLGHIAIVLGIYLLMGRRAALGTNVSLYLSTAIVPFIVWSYTHQKIIISVSQNAPLTSFPIVGFVEIIIARSFVELLNSTIIVFIIIIYFKLLHDDVYINDAVNSISSVLLAYALGVSTGALFGIFSLRAPSAVMVGFFLIPAYWIGSGVFFTPDSLPQFGRDIVYLIPISHIVDIARTGVYPSYISHFYSLRFVLIIICLNLAFFFVFRRIFRGLSN